ncbi:lipid kinase YegS [uncultured Roseibium sp.]|uniref:lipid kinase YegS n=1 Tax=uncultured Roseibium sp. TaxID=1936171 RepID=UPI002594F674|nr:lipid kinase YegS [uncultured Roseibium sp.]
MAEATHMRVILHGKAAARDDVRAAVGAVRDRGHKVSVRVTWEAGDAQRLVREALLEAKPEKIDTLVAGGGDGTLNEVVSEALAELSESQAAPFAFGLLPLGTANDFAHGIGLDPGDLTGCLTMAAQTPARAMDVGVVNGRAFVNVATGGFGTKVTAETDPTLKRLLGGAAYVFTGLNRFSELSACEGRITADDNHWEGRFLALAVGNGRQAGGGVQLCPEAILDDGLLDLTVIPYPEADEVPEVLAQLFEKGQEGLKEKLVLWKVRDILIETNEPLQINLDGEPIHDTRLEVATLPGRISFRRP